MLLSRYSKSKKNENTFVDIGESKCGVLQIGGNGGIERL